MPSPEGIRNTVPYGCTRTRTECCTDTPPVQLGSRAFQRGVQTYTASTGTCMTVAGSPLGCHAWMPSPEGILAGTPQNAALLAPLAVIRLIVTQWLPRLAAARAARCWLEPLPHIVALADKMPGSAAHTTQPLAAAHLQQVHRLHNSLPEQGRPVGRFYRPISIVGGR